MSKRLEKAKIVFLCIQFFLLVHDLFFSTITDLERIGSIGISCMDA